MQKKHVEKKHGRVIRLTGRNAGLHSPHSLRFPLARIAHQTSMCSSVGCLPPHLAALVLNVLIYMLILVLVLFLRGMWSGL